jgi:topoisomerase IA-like protein
MGKIDITLYSEADITSKKMEKLRHNKLAKINAVETHVFPHKNKIDRDGEDVYLLVYRGEGRYSAWVDGKIVDYLEMNTNRINTDAELWIRINNPDSNTDGWINTEEYKNKDFFRAAGTGIFLKPSFKNSRSNNWS